MLVFKQSPLSTAHVQGTQSWILYRTVVALKRVGKHEHAAAQEAASVGDVRSSKTESPPHPHRSGKPERGAWADPPRVVGGAVGRWRWSRRTDRVSVAAAFSLFLLLHVLHADGNLAAPGLTTPSAPKKPSRPAATTPRAGRGRARSSTRWQCWRVGLALNLVLWCSRWFQRPHWKRWPLRHPLCTGPHHVARVQARARVQSARRWAAHSLQLTLVAMSPAWVWMMPVAAEAKSPTPHAVIGAGPHNREQSSHHESTSAKGRSPRATRHLVSCASAQLHLSHPRTGIT